MSNFLIHAHSGLPYIILALLLVVLVMSFIALNTKKVSALHVKLARITMILSHIQLLIGVLTLFFGTAAQAAFSTGMGEVMKNAALRSRYIEHPTMMIIGIALLTIGFSKAKRTEDPVKKNRSILTFYLIALVLFLAKIPYDTWLNF